jgi:hypothetical protein
VIRLSVSVCAAIALIASNASAQTKAVLFAGTVMDSLKQPLSNAEVSFPGMGISRTTDDKGAFRIENVTAGVHRVRVRHIGHGQIDTTMVFREDQNLEWRFTLGRIITLDSVVVTAPLDPLMAEFESNRARGFGRFMTRADLARQDGVTLANVMRGLPGADIMRTNSGTSFVTSKRAPISGCQPTRMAESRQAALIEQERTDECLRRERIYYVPDETEKRMGYRRACFPLVFVDRQLMNPGRATPPFDINTYATEQIEAVEWYESESQTPAKYSVNSARCGVLVLHIRKKK